jgi:sulfide:quinone oxidoreductase
VYQPGLLFAPFAPFTAHTRHQLVHPRHQQLHPDIEFRRTLIDHVDVARDRVLLDNCAWLDYDVLIVATGARLVPEETEGLTGEGWGERVHTFYTLRGAELLGRALDGFEGGRVVVNVVDMPIKCPVAPLEFCFLADEYFHHRGIRDKVELTYVTPLDGAFTKPVASRALGNLLRDKGIGLVTEFNTGEVDGKTGRLIAYDGREVPFDLAVVVPLHEGAGYVERSADLGDELGFVRVDPKTLQSLAKPNVFALGDATDVPASKAGSVAHFEGEIVERNVLAYLADRELPARFDGHANCFVETGFGRALLIDFNYDTEPLPGHYPATLGLPLLAQSRLNHVGKLAFRHLYWHELLPGRRMPGIGTAMPLQGKRINEPTREETRT